LVYIVVFGQHTRKETTFTMPRPLAYPEGFMHIGPVYLNQNT